MKALKISLLAVAVLGIAIAVYAMTGPTLDPPTPVYDYEHAPSTNVFTVEEANAMVACGMAKGSNDLYPDAIHGDCYDYIEYAGILFAPECEHLYNPMTNTYLTETKCYVLVRTIEE